MSPQDRRLQKALWRYGIISPLLHRTDDDLPLAQMIQQLADKTFLRPDNTPVTLSAEALRKWLYRYRAGGLDSLIDKTRSDKGSHDIPQPLAEAMADLRRCHPAWPTSCLLQRLMQDGHWNGIKPSRASLYRYAATNRMQRDVPAASQGPMRPFAFDAFGQLWIADFMHGPRLRYGRRFRKAILHAIIDDATRYVVCAHFGWQETVQCLMTELMRAVHRFGICQRFYTDNGPCYASSHLKQVCARLGVHLVHSRPYRPQGRGKVERFFRTVRDQFLVDQNARTIEQLNDNLNLYLAEYHQRRHRGIGQSPLQKRLAGDNVCRQLPEVTDIRHLFAAQKSCRVYNNGTIRINRQVFEVPDALPATRIQVCYLPWEPGWVFYGNDLKPARPVDPYANAKRFNHPKGGLP